MSTLRKSNPARVVGCVLTLTPGDAEAQLPLPLLAQPVTGRGYFNAEPLNSISGVCGPGHTDSQTPVTLGQDEPHQHRRRRRLDRPLSAPTRDIQAQVTLRAGLPCPGRGRAAFLAPNSPGMHTWPSRGYGRTGLLSLPPPGILSTARSGSHSSGTERLGLSSLPATWWPSSPLDRPGPSSSLVLSPSLGHRVWSPPGTPGTQGGQRAAQAQVGPEVLGASSATEQSPPSLPLPS